MKKTAELKEIKSKDIKTLNQEIVEENKKLINFRFKAEFRNLKNYSEIAKTRKKIARLKTILNEKLLKEVENKENK